MADKFHEWWDKSGYTAKDIDKYTDIKRAWYKAKKEVFDEMFKMIEGLTIIDVQLQHMKLKIEYKGKKHPSLTRVLIDSLDEARKRHLSTFQKEKKHNNDFKKVCHICKGRGVEDIGDIPKDCLCSGCNGTGKPSLES